MIDANIVQNIIFARHCITFVSIQTCDFHPKDVKMGKETLINYILDQNIIETWDWTLFTWAR